MIPRIIQFILFMLLFGVVSCYNGNAPTEINKPDKPPTTESPYKIAYVSDRDMERHFQVYIMDSDGSNQTRLTQDSQNYLHPRFSPDGSKIVFYSHLHDYDDEIYIINSDGSNHINLTKTLGNDNFPQFSPDGSNIVFSSDRDGNREIYLMDVNGNNQLRLTNNDVIDHAPQFSPDGSKILFFSIDSNWAYNVYTMDLDGHNLKNLTSESLYFHFPINIDDSFNIIYWYAPQYSPDGSKIVFTSYSYSELNIDIYIMNSDGSSQRRLTSTPGYNFSPRFSPDGSQIVFMTHRGRNFDIYTMDLDDKNQIPLYDSKSGHAIFSQYYPDGSRILFIDDNDFCERYKIYIMNSNGNNPTKLTDDPYQDYFPQFQPQH